MKLIYRAAFSLAILITGLTGQGQLSQTQYFMNFPQANLANPAFRPSSKVFIALPVISNTYISINNNLTSLSNLFQPLAGTDSIMTPLHPDYDRSAFLDKMGKRGYFSADVSTQILGVGFGVKDDWYIDMNLSYKASASVWVPRDLFTFLLEGNESFIGSSIDLSGFGMEAYQYLEMSAGISKNIMPNLRVGGRFKLLFGGVGASLDNRRLEIDVNNDFSHTLHTDMTLNLNGPMEVITDADNLIEDIIFNDEINPFEILLNGKNSGVAFDLGASYDLMENLTFSASIIDLGFVKWKSNTFNLEANNRFSFDGFDVSGVIAGDLDFDEMLDNFLDSLKNSFDLTDGETYFNTGLSTKIYLGAFYRPVKFFGVGLLSRSAINERHMSESLSLSANLYAGDALSTSITYTMTNRSYNNLGFGFAVRFGGPQFYFVADQIPVNWVKFVDSEERFAGLAPDRIDFFNFRFGLNLVFGKVNKSKVDTPMLVE